MVDIDDVANLPDKTRQELIDDLVDAVGFWRACRNRRTKDEPLNKSLAVSAFLHDVAEAMAAAGLPVKRWRKKYDNGGPESPYLRFARKVGEVCGIRIPCDQARPAKRASEIHEEPCLPLSLETKRMLNWWLQYGSNPKMMITSGVGGAKIRVQFQKTRPEGTSNLVFCTPVVGEV
ncbi:MAG: hypothetical protein GY788_08895 [bacterium]|nr:hypothetical protein [bacterium]